MLNVSISLSCVVTNFCLKIFLRYDWSPAVGCFSSPSVGFYGFEPV